LAELALVLPLLSVFLCTIIEFGWFYYSLAAINTGCRIGAAVGTSGTPK
jgi:Flp pilus assembly protein TadG